ncbi:hypothetical protein BXO88_09925 [Oribacterium sp. C9]|uniref:ImmA/IrrE family metallo-endopeptidase n=1 Tax=Oribacterium sp. C9 TaxID=1943579 RepID=UPI00098FFC64|nr:ImmA/IrrE family metallo-endopeptidase [Oribacterium sp. C9]OON85934.1 hypothetical protein BXO88_09925 [Oribacterium sp. C9]
MQKLSDKHLVQLIDDFASFARKEILGDDLKNNRLFDKVQESGVKLFGMCNDKFDGMCLWNSDNKQPEIYLNVDQPKNRRLFTLAHELGHLFIDYGWAPNKSSINSKEKVLSVSFRDKDKSQDTENINERIANEFAGAFLMPEQLVKKVISSQQDPHEKIDKVVEYFGVTDKAALNRLIMLGMVNLSNGK